MKNQNDQNYKTSNFTQTQINKRTDRALSLIVPGKQQNSDDQIEDSDIEHKPQRKKYSDELYKMIPKISYKEVILQSKKQDYDMYSYQVNSKGSNKEKAFVLSRTELKKTSVPVDSKPIKVYDKLVYMSKAGPS